MQQPPADLLALVARIVSAHVGHNSVGRTEIPRLIRDVYETLVEIGQTSGRPMPVANEQKTQRRRAGPTEETLTCRECGMTMKMLKRHLLTVHGMTPELYREKHNLAADAPMVTSNYAELRSQLARASGLGKRPGGLGKR